MITKENLRKYFIYNKESGELTRRVTVGNFDRWKKGTTVGTKDKDGYIVTHFDGKSQKVHRLIWVYLHGSISGIIDHIDRNPSNNRIENLRVVTKKTNSINSKLPSNNTSGHKGVCFCRGKWQSRIKVDGRTIYLGSFTDISLAIKARKKAEEEHGFTEVMGRNNEFL
jgi:hypothetical protein